MTPLLALALLTAAPDSPLAMIPNDVVAYATVASPASLLGRLEGPETLAALRKAIAGQSLGPEEVVILDSLDPSNWRAVGLDPERALGLGCDMSGTAPVIYVVVGVADSQLLEQRIRALADERDANLRREEKGGAVVLTAGRRNNAALLLRGQWGVLAAGPAEEAVEAATARLAVLAEADSVAAGSDVLPTGPDGAAMVHYATLMERVVVMAKRRSPHDELAVLLALTKGVNDVRIGLDLSRGVELTAHIGMSAPNVFVDALLPVEGSFGALAAAGDPLHLVAGARVDPTRIGAALTALAEATHDERDLAEMKRSMKDEVGLDWDNDFLPVLTGEVGLALAGALDTAERRSFPFYDQSALVVGVKEEATATVLIQKLFAKTELSRHPGPMWAATLDGRPSVELMITHGAFVVARAAKAAARLAKGVSAASAAGLRGLVAGPHAAIVAVSAAWLLYEPDREVAAVSYREDENESAQPVSKEQARHQAKVAAVYKRLEALRAKERVAERGTLKALAPLLGVTWATLDKKDGGLVLRGGQRLGAESLTAFARKGLALLLARVRAELAYSKASQSLYEELDRLEAQNPKSSELDEP